MRLVSDHGLDPNSIANCKENVLVLHAEIRCEHRRGDFPTVGTVAYEGVYEARAFGRLGSWLVILVLVCWLSVTARRGEKG